MCCHKRLSLILWIGLNLTIALTVSWRAFAAAGDPPAIELRLSANKTKLYVGDPPIRVRVELWNRGTEDFIAGGEFAPILNAPTFVDMDFSDSGGRHYRGLVIKTTLTEQGRNGWWTRIVPGHYYGYEFDLDAQSYSFLTHPGRFKATARYVSKAGNTASSPNLISGPVWEGELLSNPVWIEVLPSNSQLEPK